MANGRKPPENCTPEHITMIEAFLSGASKRDAFITAFPKRAAALKDVDTIALREFRKEAVQKEIEKRNKIHEKVLEEQYGSEIERITKLWSRETHVKRLMELAEAARKRRGNGEDMDRDAISAGKLERDTLDSLGKVLGYDAPIKIDADSKVTVSFDTGDGDPGAGEDDWTG